MAYLVEGKEIKHPTPAKTFQNQRINADGKLRNRFSSKEKTRFREKFNQRNIFVIQLMSVINLKFFEFIETIKNSSIIGVTKIPRWVHMVPYPGILYTTVLAGWGLIVH